MVVVFKKKSAAVQPPVPFPNTISPTDKLMEGPKASMGIRKPSIQSRTLTPTPMEKTAPMAAKEVTAYVFGGGTEPLLQGKAVTLVHEWPKEYKVCKKGDTGVVLKVNPDSELYKVRLDNPSTNITETWVRFTDVRETKP